MSKKENLYPTTKTSLIKFLNKPQLKPKHGFPFIRFYSCCSAILPTVERETALNSKFHASSGFQTLPRKLPSRKRDLKRYSEMFRDYTQTKNLKEGKVLHGELVRNLIDLDMHLYVSLINFYAKSGDLSSARKVFDQMPDQNLVSWNAFLNGYAQEGEWQEVLRLFCSLSESEFRFSSYTLSTVLKSCANVGNLRVGQVLHSVAIKIGSEFDNYISSSLVDMYSKFRFPEDSMKVFKRIRSPDVVAWSTMINGLDQQGHKKEAFQLFQLMRH
nr:pentatricopeptide repeat-containing protein At3g24000, mitochondrial-like isoform X2 [Ipomoea trifida]